MKHFICALFGLLVAASIEASHGGNLHAFSVADSSQSFCNQCSKIADIQSDIEKRIADSKTIVSHQEKHTIFSLLSVINCRTDNYSFLGKNFVRTRLLSGSEILFPTDGCQMDSEEVVQLSGANLEDGLVTKFYMAAFGLIKWEGEYLEMGFDEDNLACRILNTDSMSNKKRKNFIRNFYKIASTSVGRTLLYRLLLEIRRTDTERNGCIDETIEKTLSTNDIDKRNTCRSIEIITPYKTKSNAFNFREKNIKFYSSNDTKETNIISEKDKDKVEITKAPRTDDVGLFHEMLHWFHTLRDPKRKKREKIKCGTNNKGLLLSKASMESEKTELWLGRDEKGNPLSELIMNMEEFRTIMGYTVNFSITIDGQTISYTAEEVLNGDDLSENLYRLCVGQQLRYGHVTKETTIPIETANRARKFYENIIGNYKIKSR